MFTNKVIFSKTPNLMGGLTLVRNYCSQPSKHPHCPPRLVWSFFGTNKS